MQFLSWFQIVLLVLLIAAISLSAGIVLNRLIHTMLNQDCIYESIIKPLKGIPVIWSILIGMYALTFLVPVTDGVQSSLYKLIFALLLLSLTIIIARIVAELVRCYTKKTQAILPASSILITTAEAVIYAAGLLITLQSVGISITPVLTALGVGGLAVALALQETLSNLFAGLHILISSQIRIGDYIKLNTGEEGFVDDISWRITKIKTLGKNTIIVPNSKVASSILVNYHVPQEKTAFIVPIGVSYGSDLDKVERVTLEVATEVVREVCGGVTDSIPIILFHSFGEYSINIRVILYAKHFVSQFRLRHEFIKRLYRRFRQEGIEIPICHVMFRQNGTSVSSLTGPEELL
ncbi:MAG TPA: mechanosensitive ion channel family protein [Methylomusa anaerophila]|uniref:Mechanosensitive channel MscK n=1 Tax=Methylomusa anaerophila TaxID=1930071 RepID=A0A348ALZ3_9FIRM|nr:mechanosensitive ion channel family protein [Methylomusa anaerophila]BBB92091.1 mechanosensitive channel MscK precursor [Methylomusa anaerophila]HML87895.1 mechanosensitive ion channel family protein [Methylomusa anaerophila]